jgi:outer membrane protein TolC
MPAEVLRRQPDVRRAERQLAAETARVGVATAELYPKFTLTGTIGLESLSLSNLTDSDSQTFGIGPSVRWNLFDGGRTRQQMEIQSAVQEQAMVQYEASVLAALEDVKNAITAFTQEQLRYRSLNVSAASAERAADIAKTRYQAGATNFLTVLDAQRTLLSAQDRRSASQGKIVSNLIRLYKSLGGGWTTIARIDGCGQDSTPSERQPLLLRIVRSATKRHRLVGRTCRT